MRGVSTDYQPGNILLDTMNGVGVLTTVWLCVIFPGLDGYINNFAKFRLRALEDKITRESDADVQAMIKDWDSYVDVSQPEYECSRVALTVVPNTEDGYLFNLTVTFKSYTSIVFVDALRVGMFSYQRSYDDKTTPDHEVGNPIRFCGGVDYTGDMYTVEPRPKCPTSPPRQPGITGEPL